MKSHRTARRGTTAVEFAVVAPIALLFTFGLIEVSTLLKIDGALITATIEGGREASISTASAEDVDQVIRESLSIMGISNPEIEITPHILTRETTEITIAVSLDSSPDNGFLLRNFFSGRLRRSATFERF